MLFKKVIGLENEAYPLSSKATKFVIAQIEYAFIFDKKLSAGGTVKSAQNLEKGGFSGAASSDYGLENAFLNIDIKRLQRVNFVFAAFVIRFPFGSFRSKGPFPAEARGTER